jgi:PAS domain S-box-containing protein
MILNINNTFSQITGYSREDAIGKNPRILQSGMQSPEFYADMWQALLTEDYWSGEVWNRRKNGEVYAEMKTISAVRDEHGVTTHYVALGNDITLMKEQQNQLEHIAHFDLLTNLPNRSLLADRLSHAMGLNLPLNTSVNIAAVQLQQPDFTQRLTLLLAANPDVDARYL